ncbi:MAG: helix-turn-helix transcriptional regulator [Geminicoccaceae bacterium]|nr:helix-turn-helix transcriptional regulator [Geminicoccaceae bacterium]
MNHAHERLRKARIAAGYKSGAAFAREVGIEPGTYGHHESGKRGFARFAARYSRLLNVSATWLLGEEAAPQPDVAEMAMELASKLTPEQRALWFSLGRALAEQQLEPEATNGE